MTIDSDYDNNGIDSGLDLESGGVLCSGATQSLFVGDTMNDSGPEISSLNTMAGSPPLEVQRFDSNDALYSGTDGQFDQGEGNPPYGSASAEFFSKNGGFSLSGLLELLDEERIFAGGILDEVTDQAGLEFTVIPYFAGHSSPGAGILISILDEVGSEAGRAEVTADPAGNWVAKMPGVILRDYGYTIQLVQTRVSWGDASGQPSEPLETFFVGANLAPPTKIPDPVAGKILGVVLRGKSALEMVEELTREQEF